MIICGFAGIGKSFLATNGNRWVDLESTPFKKNWDLYSDVAIHMDKNGYDVMLSCHKPLRDILIEKGVDFYVFCPRLEDKSEYIKRYVNRGNTQEFIDMFEENYDKFVSEIFDDKKLKVVPMDGDKFLSDYIMEVN